MPTTYESRPIIVNGTSVGSLRLPTGTQESVWVAELARQVAAYTPVSTPSTDITITSDTYVVAENQSVSGDCSSRNVTAFLETAANCFGQVKMFKKTDSSTNTFTIQAYGSEQIQNITSANTLVITSMGTAVILRCNGIKWDVVA